MKPARMTVGYIPKGFPRISETFVSNEILELERMGMDIRLFSLFKPGENGIQPSARAVRAPLHYVPHHVLPSLHRLVPAHLALVFKRPRAYWKTLRWAVRRCVRRRSMATLRRFAQAGFLVQRLLRDQDIPHFHAHFCHGPATVALILKWLTGATFSFTAHAKDLYTSAPDALREKMREAEFVLTCTEANHRYLTGVGGDVARVHRVYHGIDLERFTPAYGNGASNGSKKDSKRVPVILSVGRLVEKKGHDVLIRACALLRDRGVRFRCVIHGEGPFRGRLEAVRRSLGLNDLVELPGRILQDDLVDRYAEADVFALGCQVLADGDRDGLPNVLIEALAMQVPVVSTTVSGVPELIENNVHGLLVPPRAPEALANAIEKLLSDPALRRRLGRNGRRRVVQEFDTRRNTRRVFELFESLNLRVARVATRPIAGTRDPATATPR
jgi:glycosyltransferase involved in cell wall biosynthesis